MAWLDRALGTRTAPDEKDGSSSGGAGKKAEDQDPGSMLASAFLEPLRIEANRVDGPKCDRSFRQLLGEVKYDLEEGLTQHSAARASETITEALPVWFEGRRTSGDERAEQLMELLEALGASLFKMEGRDDRATNRIKGGLSHLHARGSRTTTSQMQRIISNVIKAVDDMQSEREKRIRMMSAQIRELHEKVAEKEAEAQIDRLTGLNNRATFDDHIDRVLRRADLAPYTFTLLMLDIDHFKTVNDRFGHVEGDRALREVANQLERVVLRRDDFIARYGGEEFAVVLGDADAESGRMAAERIRNAVEKLTMKAQDKPLSLTVSIGVAQGCRSDTATKLIRRADDCLYIAKQNGRNRVVVAGQGDGCRVKLPPLLVKRAQSAQKAKRAERLSASGDQGSGPMHSGGHKISSTASLGSASTLDPASSLGFTSTLDPSSSLESELSDDGSGDGSTS